MLIRLTKIFQIILLQVLVAFVASTSPAIAETSSANTLPIINGEDTQDGEFPWMAALYIQYGGANPSFYFICGASLISPDLVLTAAHCVYQDRAYPSRFRLGIGKRSRSQATDELLEISRISIHPDFNYDTIDNDLALLKLKTPLVDVITPTLSQWPDLAAFENVSATVLGWGQTDPSPNSSPLSAPENLRKATLPVRSDAQCLTAMEKLGPWYNPRTMLCAGVLSSSDSVVDGRDACVGDSGGPLFVTHTDGAQEIVGVVSWGILKCANSSTFGVYAEVAQSFEWIHSNPAAFPVMLEQPSISGNPVVGQLISCNPGTWKGEGLSYSYQWHKYYVYSFTSEEISRARDSVYIPTNDDLGAFLFCTVKVRSSGGAEEISSFANREVVIPDFTGKGLGKIEIKKHTYTCSENTCRFSLILQSKGRKVRAMLGQLVTKKKVRCAQPSSNTKAKECVRTNRTNIHGRKKAGARWVFRFKRVESIESALFVYVQNQLGIWRSRPTKFEL